MAALFERGARFLDGAAVPDTKPSLPPQSGPELKFFFQRGSPLDIPRQFTLSTVITGLSTVAPNHRESLANSLRIHVISTLNPQLLHVNISVAPTLYVGHAPGWAPKYSALFLAPAICHQYKEVPPHWSCVDTRGNAKRHTGQPQSRSRRSRFTT